MHLSRAVELAREIAHDVAATHAEAVDREARWPAESLRALQAAGLAGLVVPTRYGGLGLGLDGLAQVCDALGRACGSTALCFGMHCVGSAVLAARPTDAQARDYLAPIVAGEHLTTLALSEPGTGAHFYFPQCECEAQGGRLRVSGTKSFVTNGGHADSYVVSVLGHDDRGPAGAGRFSCVVVDQADPGLRWGEPWDGLGLRGNASRELLLEAVELPRERLLGREGDQLWYVFQVVAPYFLVAMSGAYMGITQAALDACVAAVSTRSYAHDGRRVAESAVVQHRLGTVWADAQRARSFLLSAARDADRNADEGLLSVLSVKAEVGDCASRVLSAVSGLLGGRGYRAGGAIDRLRRDALAVHVMSPTTDLLRQWVGRALLGQPLLGS